MRMHGNPGPSHITVIFDEGEFAGKSLTILADPLVGGVALYANSIKYWDDNAAIDQETKKKIIETIRKEFSDNTKNKSEVVE